MACPGLPATFVFRRFRHQLVPLLLLPAGLVPGALPLQQAAIAQERGMAPQATEPMLRVLLAESSALTIAALDRPLRLNPGGIVIPAGQSVRLLLQDGVVVLDDGRSRELLPAGSALWLQPFSLRAVIGSAVPAAADAAQAEPPQGDFQLQQRRYRGQLQVLVGRASLQAVNHVPLETYLPSVVGSEMPASWPQPALRAQAVAARTYALRQRKPAAAFDVKATVASQVYKGIEAERPSTREAVAATRGQVLTFDGDLANAVFHSSAGGSTENSGDLWSRQLPYLVSVPDFDAASPVSQWQQRLDPEMLRKAFREIGGATRIDVLATTGSGRIHQARVIGPAGTLVLTGPELRSRLGLRSTMVRFETVAPEVALVPAEASASQPQMPPPLPSIDSPPLQLSQPTLMAIGRGFGHGVGMSQWGAYAMAQQGRSYEQILSHYYRGTQLRPYGTP
jgi:stage II sporulation protein D